MNKEELKSKIKPLIKDVIKSKINNTIDSKASEYDELTKFPELKEVLIDLLTLDYNVFLSSIDWVSPRPTTFKINLKNNQNFFLMFGKRSWIAQVEGKKYYLLNLPEEERAAEAISRILRYGSKTIEGSQTDDELMKDFAPTDIPNEVKPEDNSNTETKSPTEPK